MENIFREEQIKINGETRTLLFKSVKEIFKFGDLPYLIIGKSGAGKSTLAVDIIHQFAQEATKIYYISETQDGVDNGAVNTIPQLFRRSPEFESINNLWQEIKLTSESMTATPSKLLTIIGKVYSQKDTTLITMTFNDKQKELRETLKNKYSSQNVNQMNTMIQNDIDIWSIECLSRILLSGINQYGSKNLSNSDMEIVKSLISTQPKTILILDDVTRKLEAMKRDKKKVIFNNETISVSDAYKQLLIDILTRSRHFNMITCIFLHNWTTLDVKSNVDNFIVLDEIAANNLTSIRTIGTAESREFVKAAVNLVKRKYDYHLVVCKDSGKNVMVTKADLHIGATLEVDDLNKKFLDVYNSVANNTNYTPSQNTNANMSDDEEEETSEFDDVI